MEYFSNHIGSTPSRQQTLAWQALGYAPQDLSELELPFSHDELREVIDSMPIDKALEPDGFTGKFYKSCWGIIKEDILLALNSLYTMNAQGLQLLSTANIVLLPKKGDATEITDYRPISLIHSVTKIVTKLLANRLAPRLGAMISNCQSTFIKKRSIHDNFMYV